MRKKWVVTDCKLKNTNCHELTINYQRRWTQVTHLTHLTQLTQLTRVTQFLPLLAEWKYGGTKMENFYLISQSGNYRCRKACLRRNFETWNHWNRCVHRIQCVQTHDSRKYCKKGQTTGTTIQQLKLQEFCQFAPDI